MIILPLETSFGSMPPKAQKSFTNEVQARANRAGLAGIIVPVWDMGDVRMGFIAPTGWHPFFQTIGLPWIYASLNREIFW